MKQFTIFNQYTCWLLVLTYLVGNGWAYAQTSPNKIKYQVTYNTATQTYTAWVVPDYSTPNANNPGSNELVSTAQVTLKVPAGFSIQSITDAGGSQSWDKAPVKFGQGLSLTLSNGNVITQDYGTGVLDPNYAYYVINKAPTESNLGSFTVNTPVALFSFKGNGCYGPVGPMNPGDAFIQAAMDTYGYNVSNSFYSVSGQPVGGNQDPLEQYLNNTGTPAVSQATTLTLTPDFANTTTGLPVTGNVLANDQDPNGGTLTASLLTPPSAGTAVITPDGSYTYTPPDGFTGTTSFCYSASSSAGGSGSSCVSITVMPPPAVYTVKYQVTYNTATQTYTAWVVPDYSTPNANNPGSNELVSTAQVTLKVPAGFSIQSITDAGGSQSWDKAPVKFGQGLSLTLSNGNVITQDYGTGVLDPNYAYYVINKAPTESNLGSFTVNTPVALFSFKGTGCYGPVGPMNPGDAFIQAAMDTYGYNVPNSFYSASGQPAVMNQQPVEQYISNIGAPAGCSLLPLVMTPDIAMTIQGTPVSGNVLTNDNDPNGGVLSASLLSAPATGTVVVNPDGSYLFTPPTGFTGTATFCYNATSTVGLSGSSCVSVNVFPAPTAGNNAPVANNDATQTTAGLSVTINVLANDTDPDSVTSRNGQLGVPTLPGQPIQGTATVDPTTGIVTYSPPAGFTGLVTFTYQVCDTGTPALCSTAVVSVNVLPDPPTGTTLAPVAGDDAFITSLNTSVTGTVAANDRDPNNPALPLTYTSGQPAHGSVVMSTGGVFTFTPVTGYVGPDSFTYLVCNSAGLCRKATVSIYVAPLVNQSPQVNPDVNTFIPGLPTAGNVLTNDKDPEGGSLTAQVIGTPPAGFTLTPDGSYTYNAPANQTTPVTVAISVCDKGTPPACSSSTLTLVPVTPPNALTNDAPVALNDAVRTTAGVSVTVNVLANDKDPEGLPLSNPVLVSGPSHGTAVVNADGTVSYKPSAGFVGVDGVVYQVCDTGTPPACSTAGVTFSVDPAPPTGVTNTAPVAVDDQLLTTKNTSASGTVAANDRDAEGQPLVYSRVSSPASGTVVLAADGSYSYTPGTGFVGTTNFAYQVCDNATPALCATATVYITVSEPAGNPPVIVAVPVDVDPGKSVTVCMPIIDADAVDSFTASICSQPGVGTAAVSVNNATRLACVTYLAPSSGPVSTSVCVEICDSYGNCKQTVIPVIINPVSNTALTPLPPGVVVVPVVTPKDTPVQVCMPIRDPNAADTHTVSVCGSPAKGSATATVNNTTHELCISYIPTPGTEGQDGLCVVVCDPSGQCTTVTVPVSVVDPTPPGVTPVNPKVTPVPVVTTPDTPVVVCTPIVDNAGDTHTAGLCSQPASGTAMVAVDNVTHTLCITYVPGSQPVSSSLCVQVCDQGGLCTTLVAPVSVVPKNQSPQVNPDVNTFIPGLPTAGNVLTNDKDPEGSSLTAQVIGTPPAGFTLTPDGSYTYNAPANQTTPVTVAISVCDKGTPPACSSSTLTLVPVTPPNALTNDAPVALNDAVRTTAGVSVTVNVLANDKDPEGLPLSNPVLVSGPSHGTAVVNADGTVSYWPTAGFVGVDGVVYRVCDTGTPPACSTAGVTFSVDPAPPSGVTNTAPVAVDDQLLTTKNTSASGTVAANDRDAEGQPLIYSRVSSPASGTVVLGADGSYTYTPGAGFVGTTNFAYQVCDNATPALCTTATVYITVSDPCAGSVAAPLITPQAATVCTSQSILLTAIGETGADFIWQGSSLPASVTGMVLSLSGLPAGTYSYTVIQVVNSCTSLAASTTVLSSSAVCTYRSPVVNPDIALTSPGKPVSGNVLTNDSDPQGLPLVTTVISQPGAGTVSMSPNGSYTYTPPATFTGTVIFCYAAINTAGRTGNTCVTVQVVPDPSPVANNAPIASDDNTRTVAGVPVVIAVLANDSDPDSPTSLNGQLSNPTLLSQPNAGTATVNANGTVSYTPPAGFTGVVSFPYQICDKGTPALCATAVVTVVVVPTPPAGTTLAPVAVDDVLLVQKDTPGVGTVAGNDRDPNSPALPLYYTVNQLTGGGVVMSPNGSFTYTPAAGYTGPASFIYRVCNSAGLCDKATVHVLVQQPVTGFPPVIVGEPVVTTQGKPVTVCMPIVDADVVDSFTASVCGQPSSGTIGLSVNPATRQVCVIYTPATSFTGATTGCIRVCDSYGNCTQTIIPVSVIPASQTAIQPQAPAVIVIPIVTPKDTPVQVCMPIADVNPGDTHSVSVCGSPAKGLATATVNNSSHAVCVSFTPAAGQTGNDQLCLTVCDNSGLCTQVNVPVQIVDPTPPGPGLEPPVVVPPVIVTRPNQPIVVCTGITDSLTDTHTASLCSPPGSGTVQLSVDNTLHTLCIAYTPGTTPVNTSVCVQVCDQTGQCTTVIVPVTVIPGDPGPCLPVDLAGVSVGIPDGGVITAGQTASFTLIGANPAYKVNWFMTPAAGVSPATSGTGVQTGNLTFAQAGEYAVWFKLTNNSLPAGCPVNSEALVKGQLLVNPGASTPCPAPSPVSVSASQSNSLTTGQTATFVMQGGSPNTGVSWSVYPATGASPASGTGTIATVAFSQQGSYVLTFVATNSPGGCVAGIRSGSTAVYVRDGIPDGGDCLVPAPVSITPNSVTAQAGNSVTFTATGELPGQLTWTIIPAGNASPVSGTGPVAMPVFTAPGTYIITFTATNTGFPAGCTLPASTATSMAYQVLPGTTTVALNLKVLLQGALLNSSGGLMRDALRSGGYLPLTEPYSAIGGPRFVHKGGGGGETMPASVTAANAGTANAVVDWVFVELRNPANMSAVVATRSALVQRDGDVVLASDGTSPLTFTGLSGSSYYVSIKHRNHLGVMTATAIPLSATPTVVDFTSMTNAQLWDMPGSQQVYDGSEQVTMTEAGGRKALWAGNAYNDANEKPGLWPDRVKYQGPDNDLLKVFSEVMTYPGNQSQTYNYDQAYGYFFGDVNLDGKVKYQGPNNDANIIFMNVIDLYPFNTGKLYNFDLFLEQVP